MIILAGRWHISERVFMAVLPIRLFPDPVLRTRADEVTEFDGALEKLVAVSYTHLTLPTTA